MGRGPFLKGPEGLVSLSFGDPKVSMVLSQSPEKDKCTWRATGAVFAGDASGVIPVTGEAAMTSVNSGRLGPASGVVETCPLRLQVLQSPCAVLASFSGSGGSQAPARPLVLSQLFMNVA